MTVSSPLLAQMYEPVVPNQIERSELPMTLLAVYEHWEKDLQYIEIPEAAPAESPLDFAGHSWTVQVALVLLVLAVGVMLVGDASARAVADKVPSRKEL